MSSSGEVLYTFRTAYPDVLQVDRAQRVAFPVFRNGALVTPSGGTFSLLAPDGTAIVDEDPIDVQDDVGGFDLTDVHLDSDLRSLGDGYQERCTLVLPDHSMTIDRECCLALRPLYPVITDQDLIDEYPTLRQQLGTAATSFQSWIDAGFKRIVARLVMEGQITYSIKSAWAFRIPHMELAAGLFWRHRGAQPNGAAFLAIAQDHMKAYEAAWSSISWTSDQDHDGRVDDPTQRRAPASGIVHINQSPRGFSRRADPRW